jgi:cytochrome d ubiquinol oxidase subunit II
LLGKKTYRIFLILNGILGPVLIGTAVGTFYNGANFIVNKAGLSDLGMPIVSSWVEYHGIQLHGLEAAFNIWNLSLGIAVFFLARILALLYFINNIADENIQKRSHKQLLIETPLFLVFFLTFLIHLLIQNGFDSKEMAWVEYKYLWNLIEMPAVLATLVLGVVGVLFGIIQTILAPAWNKGIWFAGIGTTLTVLALLLIAGWNNTAYYPSLADAKSSLTLENSCSSLFTLKAMSIVSLLIPFVLAYIIYAWRALDLHKIDSQEMKENEHTY